MVNFGIWLLNRKGNRESTIKRKMRYLQQLNGKPEDMTSQVLNKSWKDGTKENALDVIEQYAEFLKVPFTRPSFRAYDNTEMYVPSPEMIKQFLYRVRSLMVKAEIKTAIETGASSGEVWRLTWKDINLQSKTVSITGNKGHRTLTYAVSDELIALLLQIPRINDRIFTNINNSDRMNDVIIYYKKKLSLETGNMDFLKIHFHSFRHFAISWHYFKTKDIVSTEIC